MRTSYLLVLIAVLLGENYVRARPTLDKIAEVIVDMLDPPEYRPRPPPQKYNYPARPIYSAGPYGPPQQQYPVGPHYSPVQQYPVRPHYPSGQQYPIGVHYPTGPYYPAITGYEAAGYGHDGYYQQQNTPGSPAVYPNNYYGSQTYGSPNYGYRNNGY